jgi:hypothetical protein
METAEKEQVERLWQSARYLPRSVRLLGTRYRALFCAYAQACGAQGETAAVADAMAFIDFMLRQERVALLQPEKQALRSDRRLLRRRYRLKRKDSVVTAVERWKILQWLGL